MMTKNENLGVDLHIHTSISGGALTPTLVVEQAARRGLNWIAITDHCSIAGVEEACKVASKSLTRVVPGIELTARQNGYQVNILGLFVDPDHRCLQAHLPDYRRRPLTPAETIDLIRTACGLPILADPVRFLNGGYGSRQHLEEMLGDYKQWGLAGVEVYRPEYEPTKIALLEEIARVQGLVRSGGSDFYIPETDQRQLGDIIMPSEALNELLAAAQGIG